MGHCGRFDSALAHTKPVNSYKTPPVPLAVTARSFSFFLFTAAGLITSVTRGTGGAAASDRRHAASRCWQAAFFFLVFAHPRRCACERAGGPDGAATSMPLHSRPAGLAGRPGHCRRTVGHAPLVQGWTSAAIVITYVEERGREGAVFLSALLTAGDHVPALHIDSMRKADPPPQLLAEQRRRRHVPCLERHALSP